MSSDFFARRPAKSAAKRPIEEKGEDSTAKKRDTDDPSKSSIPFKELCNVFSAIEGTTKRLQITDYLTDFFIKLMRESRRDDLIAACLLSLSRLGPEYEGLELGLGEALLVKALAGSTGRAAETVRVDLSQRGDIGEVAETARAAQKRMFTACPLTLAALLKALQDIARASGTAATGQRVARVQGLLAACSPLEAKYLFRLLAGKLRIGLAEQSVLIALGSADAKLRGLELADPGAVLKAVFHTVPDYVILIPALLEHGVGDLQKHCTMRPGIPLKPMLAFPTRSMTEVLDRFEGIPFTSEFKYDGERAQIHHLVDASKRGRTMIFSRNSENMTGKYPDIVSDILPQALVDPSVDFVIDCEVVAVDAGKEGRLLPFQVLSTRKRKDVTRESVEVQVCLFAFDLLYCDGECLLERPLSERRDKLYKLFHKVDAVFQFARFKDTDSLEDMQAFLEEAIQAGCEGLMVKVREGHEASYEPSKRSRNWLKVKKDYLEGTSSGIGDSLDLVVVGAYYGRGKRTGVFGGFLMACYEPDAEEFQTVCKIGTGFSEADLDMFSNLLRPDTIQERPAYVKCVETVKPDIWLHPRIVWEVRAADFSLSPVYSAAIGLADPSRGISLRFPRYLRTRDDKLPEQATSAEQIAAMYRDQVSVQKPQRFDFEDEEY